MKRLAALLALAATALFADTSETVYFRAVLSPANEVPPLTITASGNATLVAHIVRDDAGTIISGSVDFLVGHNFPGRTTFQGLHIHTGAAGGNGGVTIGTDLGTSNTIVSETGIGTINKQAPATSAAALATLNGMLANPSLYYANLHTSDNPGGAIRGQLQRAEVLHLMGMMSPANEVPAIDSQASGVAHVVAIATRDASGAITSGQVTLAASYNLINPTTVTGFHIHEGLAGFNGGVTLNAIPGNFPTFQSAATGTVRYTFEVNLTNANQARTLANLFTNPQGYYINLHTTEAGGGLIRDQLRRTDLMTFDANLLTTNEVTPNPPITIEATAPSEFRLRTIRNPDGTVLAGVGEFDVNYRFPQAQVTFQGLHVHDNVAGANGPVRLDSGLSATNTLVSETGFGNIHLPAILSSATAVASMNSAVQNPERHYLNLHTSVNPGGVVRAQLAAANSNAPVVGGGGNAANGGTSAPAGLISIYGTDLAKVQGDLSGWLGSTVPASFNGVGLTIGGTAAPVLFVSGGQINAQVPVNVTAGQQPVVVTTPNGTSAPVNVTIAAAAPALFTDPANIARVIATHQNGTLIGPDSPARVGESVILWATGLGQTTPGLNTGAVVSQAGTTGTVTATIGGTAAAVSSSTAVAGTIGVYQVTVTVPAVTLGDLQVVLTMSGVSSTPKRMWVQ